MENEINNNIIKDIDNIKNDIEEICKAINSSTLTNSTKNLTDLLISIKNAIKESMNN